MRYTTYRTNEGLQRLQQEGMRAAGFHMRRKSEWVCLAIEQLLAEDPGLASLGAGEDLETFPTRAILGVSASTEEAIDRAYRIIRRQDVRAEGVMASLVRAAIRHAALSPVRTVMV